RTRSSRAWSGYISATEATSSSFCSSADRAPSSPASCPSECRETCPASPAAGSKVAMQHTRMILPGMILALTAVTTEAAFARVATDSLYTKAQNYSAALRFLRVDKGYDVVERDAEAAYLIFRYP